MLTKHIIEHIENWAPPAISWDKDNVGLQIGSKKIKIKNIFLCLELTENALKQALQKNCNLIFTHHPFLFKPLKKIDFSSDPKSKLIETLIKKNITIYSAHTNLDFTKDGVSFELAKVLELENIVFLENQNSNQYKVVVFVPQDNIDKLSESLFDAGAGIIGEYEKCSFKLDGKGTFLGNEKTNPAMGKKQKFENVNEVRLELLVDSWKLKNVIAALKNNHPYEQPAYDIYSLKNENVNYGFGAIGNLKHGMNKTEFLKHVSKKLKINSLRYSDIEQNKKINKVAVCGGSGSELLNSAIQNKADAFVTADVKYHTFHDAENKILFVDAGHYETEIHSLNAVKRKLEKFISEKSEKIKIYSYNGSTNPVKYFNNERS
ncbi:MAG: Nif3-like dinuclear metal center hexameric protein [Ignavibacteriae bacterium]|nr:Nif3-like dinuclear metal center hexameric protein [Ignavibacteriota bacterium]